jgi:hypothetical protein
MAGLKIPNVKKILTVVVIAIATLFIIHRIPALKKIVGE